jgi:hypothetical protein
MYSVDDELLENIIAQHHVIAMRGQYLKRQCHLAIDAIMKRFHAPSDCSSYINDFVGYILTATN